MQGAFRRSLIAGIVIVAPFVVTIWLLAAIVGALDSLVTPVVLRLITLIGFGEWAQSAWVNYLAPVVSVAAAVLLLYLVGRAGQNALGKQLLRWLDAALMKAPLVRGIYSATRQFLDTFGSDKKSFRQVVLVEYPRRDLWTLAFVTNEAAGEVATKLPQGCISVYVPTTPNPTSGFFLFVPEQDVIPLAMGVDEALKYVISTGVLVPSIAPSSRG